MADNPLLPAAADRENAPDPSPSRPTLDLGRRIRETRLARNMTQSELADGIFSMSYISAVERGQIRPSLGALERLAQALQVPADELLRTDVSPPTGAAARSQMPSWMTSEEADYRLHETLMTALGGAAQDALQALAALSERRLSTRQRARLQWQIALCDVALGRGEDARRAAEEGLDLANRIGDPTLLARLRLQLGRAMLILSNQQQALDHFMACLTDLDRAREQGRATDPTLAFEALAAAAQAELALGANEAAVSHLEQAERLRREALGPEQLAPAFRALSSAYYQAGDLAGAEEYAVRGIASYETAGRRRQGITSSQELANAYIEAGRPAEALTHLHAALASAQQQGDVAGEAALQAGLARAYLQQHQADEALKAADRAVALAKDLPDNRLRAQVYLAQAQALDAKGDTTKQEHALDQAIKLLQGGPAVPELSDAYARLSALLEQRGDSRRALEVLKQALQLRDAGPSTR